jgi:hypothetical protein
VSVTVARPMPVSRVAVGRAALDLVVAMVAGGVVVLAVGGGSWAVAAGGLACASGLVLGSAGRAALAGALALGAAAALAVAVSADADGERDAAFPAREELGNARVGADRLDETGVAGPHESVVRPRGDAAAEVVTGFYAALDAGRFRESWRRLSPGVQAAFGGFDAWRRGYATTLGHDVRALRAEGTAVRHVLVATDRTPCGGDVERRFVVRWRLERVGDRLRATALSAVKLAGPEPAQACP